MKRTTRVTARQAQRAYVGSLLEQIETLAVLVKCAPDETQRAKLAAKLARLEAKNAAQWR